MLKESNKTKILESQWLKSKKTIKKIEFNFSQIIKSNWKNSWKNPEQESPLKILSSKFEDLSEVNRLQIIEENERYVMKVDLEKKNCQR